LKYPPLNLYFPETAVLGFSSSTHLDSSLRAQQTGKVLSDLPCFHALPLLFVKIAVDLGDLLWHIGIHTLPVVGQAGYLYRQDVGLSLVFLKPIKESRSKILGYQLVVVLALATGVCSSHQGNHSQ
jgi:hypothetical protein